jgi:hypothetical protein
MNRRDLFKVAASATAAPLSSGLAAQPAAQQAGARIEPAWRPELFDGHQNETVRVLTEMIIPATDTPGAQAAMVNRHLDKMLKDGPEANRVSFLAGLAWLDGFALSRHGRPFVACTLEQRTALLDIIAAPDGDPAHAPGRDFFREAKRWTSRIYYNTEIGYKELNKGGRVPSRYGCSQTEPA